MADIRWGVATTLNAPAAQVLAFVAHPLDLGARRIWLHFDDPDDPAADLFHATPEVTAIRCDAAYWQDLTGQRPDTHQLRQVRNVTRVLRRARLPWVAHLDVDEFMLSRRPVSDVLSEIDQERLLIRIEPWEALHDPALVDDIFTARAFRRQLPKDAPDDLTVALHGPAGRLLDQGMLSHRVGKCIFRTGIKGMIGRIHGARIDGVNVPGGSFHPDLALLHFHAQDRAAWLARLPFRLEKGAYQYRPAMREWLLEQSPDTIAAFHDAVQLARPDLLDGLRAHGLLREEHLDLRTRVAARWPGVI